MTASKLAKRIRLYVNEEKREFFPRFFRTGKGEYGEGDKFLGIMIPDLRRVAKEFENLSLEECGKLLDSRWHEERLISLIIMVNRFKKADVKDQEAVYDLYFKHLKRVNSWDLVDTSAHVIVGGWLFNRSRKKLYTMAKSKDLWQRRIAIITTFHFIRKNDFRDTLELSEILVKDEHDLMHKGVGWMLREMGKRDVKLLKRFLDRHAATMPRTMLRYAIEKFYDKERKHYMGLAGKMRG
ncbi:DNA alkylation repair protein [Verrucomicrobia bacterium]|nr:DNA alkylation repair protein [Verrucomicrobiota bacterium]